MHAISNQLPIYRVTLTTIKILLYKLFVRLLVVKPACVPVAARALKFTWCYK